MGNRGIVSLILLLSTSCRRFWDWRLVLLSTVVCLINSISFWETNEITIDISRKSKCVMLWLLLLRPVRRECVDKLRLLQNALNLIRPNPHYVYILLQKFGYQFVISFFFVRFKPHERSNPFDSATRRIFGCQENLVLTSARPNTLRWARLALFTLIFTSSTWCLVVC